MSETNCGKQTSRRWLYSSKRLSGGQCSELMKTLEDKGREGKRNQHSRKTGKTRKERESRATRWTRMEEKIKKSLFVTGESFPDNLAASMRSIADSSDALPPYCLDV